MKKSDNNLIVIAEDSITQAEQLKYILEMAGYRILHGLNGIEAFNIIKREKPLLIISDIIMPEMDGYELCKKVKADEELKKIPVILLTALSDPTDVINGLESGADNFITKPYDEKYLLSRIQSTLINVELRKSRISEMGIEVYFNRKNYRITSDRLQILDLLLSTYENSIQKNTELKKVNEELRATQKELESLNKNLEKKVEVRTHKITRLNSLMNAIRSINQLIVKEKDPKKILQKACVNLVRVRNYKHAWIMTLDKKGKMSFIVHDGMGDEFKVLKKDLENGKWPVCCQKAMKGSEIVIMASREKDCKGCPLFKNKSGMGCLAVQLVYESKIYGILGIYMASESLTDKEEHSLVYEVAGDLGFALYNFELEEKQRETRIALEKRTYDLNERIKELNCLYGIDEICTIPGITFADVFNETVRLIQSSWQYPEVTEAKITFEGEKYQSENFRKTKWLLQTDLIIDKRKAGSVDVCYLKKKPDVFSGPFLEEEIHLLQRIAKQLEKFIVRRRAEEDLIREHHLLSTLINNTPDYICLKDTEARFILNNESHLRLMGLKSQEESLGKTDFDFFDQDSAERNFASDQTVVRTGNPLINQEELFKDSSGKDQWLLTTKVPLLNEEGKPYGLISISHDITNRKKRAQELIMAKEKAEKADKLKSLFLMNMSHEIRTPMNAIIGFSDLLSNPEISGKERKTFIKVIQESGVRLLHLIDDILDISKIESGSLELRESEFSIKRIFTDLMIIFNNQRLKIGKENLEIKLSQKAIKEDYTLRADPYRLKQIFSNLIDNALKYTESGFIEMGYSIQPAAQGETKYAKTGKDRYYIEFYVKDTGIGIPEDHIDDIFDRFRKVENKTRLYEGAGLGLAISKNLVNMMGGEIWVESVVGKGSTFYFSLPFEPSGKMSRDIDLKDKIPEKYEWTDKVILITEDEESNYKLLEHILKETQAELLWAKNGQEAIDLCRRNDNINFVLMDIKMPVMDGYTATRSIKEFRKDLPVVAITAYAADGEKEESSKAGCDDYMAKPIKIDELLPLINEYIEPGRKKVRSSAEC